MGRDLRGHERLDRAAGRRVLQMRVGHGVSTYDSKVAGCSSPPRDRAAHAQRIAIGHGFDVKQETTPEGFWLFGLWESKQACRCPLASNRRSGQSVWRTRLSRSRSRPPSEWVANRPLSPRPERRAADLEEIVPMNSVRMSPRPGDLFAVRRSMRTAPAQAIETKTAAWSGSHVDRSARATPSHMVDD